MPKRIIKKVYPFFKKFTTGILYFSIVFAYLASSFITNIGTIELLPNIVRDALSAFIIVQIARALTFRWNEFNGAQRAQWFITALGFISALATSHFNETPLTVTFALICIGLVSITWRLQSTPWNEIRLMKYNKTLLDENIEMKKRIARYEEEAILREDI